MSNFLDDQCVFVLTASRHLEFGHINQDFFALVYSSNFLDAKCAFFLSASHRDRYVCVWCQGAPHIYLYAASGEFGISTH